MNKKDLLINKKDLFVMSVGALILSYFMLPTMTKQYDFIVSLLQILSFSYLTLFGLLGLIGILLFLFWVDYEDSLEKSDINDSLEILVPCLVMGYVLALITYALIYASR